MSALLNLPGAKGGYHPLDAPMRQHTVSAGGIKEPVIEMGDLGVDEYYHEVASIREGIRALDSTSLETLRTKQLRHLQSPSDDLAVELNELAASLTLQTSDYKLRIERLGRDVGKDEARRGHWENLKAQLGRAMEKWQRNEMGQREKVRERVARQMQVVNPDVTEEEIKAVVDTTSSSSAAPQIFAQAVAGSQRSTAAQSALNDVKSRHSELLAIESTLVELAALMQQVAELVIVQDAQFEHIEQTSKSIEGDMEAGASQVTRAKLSAAAARHKRKLCLGFAAVIILVLIVVVSVQFAGSGGGGGDKDETKTVTTSAAAAATSA
ncbi:hypothetical protein JCM10207_000936 [Rhodosporidiobolus poonsookiae]